MMRPDQDTAAREARLRRRDGARTALQYLLLSVWAVVVLFPFYWMLLTSLKSYGAYNSEHIPVFFTLQPTAENYINAFTAVPLGGYLLNTLIFSLLTTAVMVVTTTLAAYAFARLRFRGRDLVFGLFLSMMMIPTELVVITNFVTITNMGLRNTFAGLVLPSITSVFYTYLLKENFEQVPDELYRAAKVDGTSDFKYLWKVMLPICRPTLVTITILKLIECWNSYVWPRLITDDPAYYLVSNGIQEIREKRFRAREHPRHDGRRRRHLGAADPSVPGLPQKDHGGRFERGHQGMKRKLAPRRRAAGRRAAGPDRLPRPARTGRVHGARTV